MEDDLGKSKTDAEYDDIYAAEKISFYVYIELWVYR